MSLRSGETQDVILSGGLNKAEMQPLIASDASHFGVLTDRAPFNGVLPTGAETRLVRGQKDRHGGDLLYGAHTIEGRHLVTGILYFRRLLDGSLENIGQRCAGVDRVTANIETLVSAVHCDRFSQAHRARLGRRIRDIGYR